MKTIEIKVYKFDELSDEAKQVAIKNYRDTNDCFAWADENAESMEAFAKLFNITVTRWSYGDRGSGVTFSSHYDDDVEALSGQRLATWLWNNHRFDLFKGKYYNVNLNKPVKHKRCKSTTFKSGNTHVAYRSAITLENSCVLTGYCMDDNILEPIYTMLEKPRDINLLELFEECFDAWIKACEDDIDYQNSDEYISEELMNNEHEFTQDGKRFHHYA